MRRRHAARGARHPRRRRLEGARRPGTREAGEAHSRACARRRHRRGLGARDRADQHLSRIRPRDPARNRPSLRGAASRPHRRQSDPHARRRAHRGGWRRCVLSFDRVRLDRRQGHARPIDARARAAVSALSMGDERRLRHAGAPRGAGVARDHGTSSTLVHPCGAAVARARGRAARRRACTRRSAAGHSRTGTHSAAGRHRTGVPTVTSHPVFRDGLFDGQVALITGGGSGIGRGIADVLASLGAHVVLASRKPERVEQAATEIRTAGGKASGVAVDVREPERVQSMIADVQREHGRIDLLVNNAAGNFYAPSESLSANAWKSVIEIDLYGTFFCSQAVLPVMREQGGGAIVNISMTLHYRGWPLMAHATAAKAGIDALTRTLALEWAPYGVRMNAIAPGPIPTEGVRKAFTPPPSASGQVPDVFAVEQAMASYAKKAIPAGRWGTPGDIANM